MHFIRRYLKFNTWDEIVISPKDYYDHLKSENINFFTGVPDSLLKDFCFYISDKSKNHIIAANEGNALSLAIGYHISTEKIPAVYLQNSGLGNLINPLLSLADKDVYSIPILLIIGWRGNPNGKDEPQHKKQGKVMLEMLHSMKIPFEVLKKNDNTSKIKQKTSKIIKNITRNNAPAAIVVEKGVFNSYSHKKLLKCKYKLSRNDAMRIILKKISKKSIIVSTTGFTSRELFEYRKENPGIRNSDFLTVGGMGHANQIAAGIALHNKKHVYCFDGDGAVIMHMGSLAINGSLNIRNLKHIVFNNGSHESVGGQPTVGYMISIKDIAKNCGYKLTLKAETSQQIQKAIQEIRKFNGAALLEIMVSNNTKSDLSRPDKSPCDNKLELMSFLKK